MEFWKICLAAVVSYLALFLSAKLVGRKQISQLDFMDYITGITIGSIAAELATDLENMWKPLVAMGIYALLTWLMSLVNLHMGRSRKFLTGTPTIVMDNGKLYRGNMKKAKLDLSEFMIMCRQQGYFDLSAIQTAVFENNGKLTILPVSTRRPVTPEDMQLKPQQEHLFVEVIMDGRILDENLRRMGLTPAWLEEQLRNQCIHGPEEVFLALCDDRRRLTCYKMEDDKKR
ncbi:MAG: YetF domain-containing protein [Aristaeellaceae bacterium]